MWTGHEYFMKKQPKANIQKKRKETLKNVYILSTVTVKGVKNTVGV